METSLNPTHLQEVQKFVRFFEQKRRESRNEVQTSFSQFQSSKIKDDILSRTEVESLISDLRDEIKITIDTELQTIVYMSGVYIKILMSQAESHNLQLQGDISFIENEKAIEEMKNLGNFLDREIGKKTQGGRLPTLQAGIHTEMAAQGKLKEITEERDVLRRRVQEQQGKITELLDDLNRYRAVSENLLAKSENMHESEVKEVSQALEETKVRCT